MIFLVIGCTSQEATPLSIEPEQVAETKPERPPSAPVQKVIPKAPEPEPPRLREPVVPTCSQCEFLLNNECVRAACCSDFDCNDDNQYTTDECINAGKIDAHCNNDRITCDDGTFAGECSITKKGYVCMMPFIELQPADFCKDNIVKKEVEEKCRQIGEGVCVRKPKFTGSKRMLVVEFIQKDLEYGAEVEGYNLIDFLNNPNEYKYLEEPYGYKVYSINSISKWFESQANDYGADLSIDIDIKGPFEVETNPPRKWFGDPCSNLDDYFNTELKKHNINPYDYDGTTILFLQNGDQIFWSCARTDLDYEIDYVSVDWVETLNVQTFDAIHTIAHEITHLFGATDKYTGNICHVPIALPNPNQYPLYPQTNACIMCGKIMIAEKIALVPDDIIDEVICDKTAFELGWTD